MFWCMCIRQPLYLSRKSRYIYLILYLDFYNPQHHLYPRLLNILHFLFVTSCSRDYPHIQQWKRNLTRSISGVNPWSSQKMFRDITPHKLRPPRDSDAMNMESKKTLGPKATKWTIWKYAHANFDQVNEMLSNVYRLSLGLGLGMGSVIILNIQKWHNNPPIIIICLM